MADGLAAAIAAPTGVVGRAPDRAILAAFAGIVAGVNAMGLKLIASYATLGLGGTVFQLAGVSAGVWFALIACYLIARDDPVAEPADRLDEILVAGMLAAAVVPVVHAGAFAVFGGGMYFTWRSSSGTRSRRVGIVLLALSGTLLWGRVTLMLFGNRLLSLDGRFVAALARTSASGNVVAFADGRHFVIGGGCSSMHNMTFAILVWGAVTQLLALRVTPRLIAIGVGAMTVNVLINAFRLAMIAVYPTDFAYLHHGDGALMFGWLGLILSASIVGWGAHDEARRRL